MLGARGCLTVVLGQDLWISPNLVLPMRQNDRMRVAGNTNRRVHRRRHAPCREWVALLSLVAVGAVSSCTPDAGPTPTPSPTFTCTAAVGACTPQQAEKEAKAAKDHAAAKAALQAGLTEVYRILGEGGVIEDEDQLQHYLAEDELNGALRAIRDFRRDQRVGHGSVSIARVTFVTDYPDTRQEVTVCEDATKFYTTDRAGKDRTPPGFRLQYTVTLKLLDGRWKRTDSTDSVKVDSCDE